MPLRLTEEQVEQFYVLARKAGEREQFAYHQTGQLLKGADVAEAPFYGIMRKVWIGLSKGTPIKLMIQRADGDWQEYAKTNNAKVDTALKIQRGPSSGLSTVGHMWVSLGKVQESIPYIYSTYRKIIRIPHPSEVVKV